MSDPKESISVPPIVIKEECDSLEADALDPSESPSCIFCFRGQSEDLLLDKSALREKIEFVLVARLQSIKVLCCRNCSQMFNLFYNFKKSCLIALSKKEELLQSLAKKSAEQRYAEAAKVRKTPLEVKEIFKCSVCLKEFTDEDEHRYHINKHFGVKPFKCRIAGCKQSFTNPRDCFVHEAICSVAPPNLTECGICATHFASQAEFEAHKVTHSASQFKCSRCGEAFLHALDCDSHELACRFQAQDPLKSVKMEDSLEDLDESLLSSVSDGSNNSERDQVFENKDEPSAERVCKHCGQTFPLANRTFFKHQRKCRPSSKKLYQCSLCELTFRKKMTLDTHLNKHKGVQSYRCRKPGCDRTFFGYSARYTHEEYCGTKGFVCDICGDTLASPQSLRMHRARHEEPQIPCVLCDKRFKTKSALQKHSATHSEERKFGCETCGKKFKSAEANRVHQRIHTQAKPYACPECDQRFTYNCSLKAHLERKACLLI